jgi:nitroreductase
MAVPVKDREKLGPNFTKAQRSEKIKYPFTVWGKIYLPGPRGQCHPLNRPDRWRFGADPGRDDMLARDKNKPLLDETAAVDEAITSRRSVRAFLPDTVPESTIREILDIASWAPSGTNMQPWRVYVTSGETKERLSRAILDSGLRAEKARGEYKYYPDRFFDPYYARRRAVGYALYGHLGIGKRDVDQMRAQHDRNFVFFDAPVGMIFTIDRRLNQGSWVDYGMFLQNIMVAARARGLHTCPQAAFAPYHQQIRPVLGIPDEEIVICGMALGYEDASKPENALRTERASPEEFATFLR